jgi:hypothetical protein
MAPSVEISQEPALLPKAGLDVKSPNVFPSTVNVPIFVNENGTSTPETIKSEPLPARFALEDHIIDVKRKLRVSWSPSYVPCRQLTL